MKEIGVGIFNCSCLAQDLDKLFEVYWYLGNQTTVPPKWPEEFATAYNLETPMQLKLNGTNATAFIGVSYELFNALVTPLRIAAYCLTQTSAVIPQKAQWNVHWALVGFKFSKLSQANKGQIAYEWQPVNLSNIEWLNAGIRKHTHLFFLSACHCL